MKLSDCCSAPIVVKGSSEATATYHCMDCGDPCDEQRKADGDEDDED
jgi:hypothetical protein